MTRPDAAYEETRRSHKAIVVTRITDTSSDPKTGEKTPVTAATNVMNAVVEPTKYSTLLRAEAAKQRMGTTTVIMWTGDLDFTELTDADTILVSATGKTLQVISSSVEDTSFVVTCEEIGK